TSPGGATMVKRWLALALAVVIVTVGLIGRSPMSDAVDGVQPRAVLPMVGRDAGGLKFLSVSAGFDHTCGIVAGGTVRCWGSNDYGQASPPSGTFVSVSAGRMHTCGVRTNQSLACWGATGYGMSNPPAGSFVNVSAGADHA